jgi:hypothetical protein
MDFLKWLALVAIAGAMALLLASRAPATDATRPPGLLPPDVPASPMPLADNQDVIPPDLFSPSLDIWKAIELQKEGNIDDALAMWNALRLPATTEHWRLLMIAVAHMQNGDEDEA